jgi:hypothetical protein
MREGSLDAPTRHPIAWQDPAFYDPIAIERELKRVFGICHGCRRCFNLCDAFPRLFDLVDESPSQELDTVDPASFKSVVDACTLCDMCFLTNCPYLPPHEFNLDFPHLLDSLGGIEETAFLRVGGETILGVPEADADRTSAEGKASSVQFVHFAFTVDQIAAFSSPHAEIVLGLSHANYHHMAMITEAVRAELTADFG